MAADHGLTIGKLRTRSRPEAVKLNVAMVGRHSYKHTHPQN